MDELQDATWVVWERTLDEPGMKHQETAFTIGNGNLCVRGSFEEGHPGQNPASFMYRIWDDMPLNFTELAALPRWWGFDVWVDGRRFGMDRGELLGYRRWLDLRTGTLTREVEWRADESAPAVNLRFERLVSLAEGHQAGVRLTITASAEPVEVRVRGGFDSHVHNTGLVHWGPVDQSVDAASSVLLVRTRATKTEVALAASFEVEGADAALSACDADRSPASQATFTLDPGRPVTVTKFVAIVPGLDADDPVAEASSQTTAMREAGWASWKSASDTAWEEAWDACDVTIEGDAEAQLSIRFSIFHMLISGPRFTDQASIGAKTLSGFGYRHHAFWDTEIFMLPLFSYTQPEVARNMLMYRWHRLPGARQKASENGYRGAQFPWESAGDGSEVTPKWVIADQKSGRLQRIWTGDIEIHITADIAMGVMQYWAATGDDSFMRDYGAEIVLDGASFWASAATLEDDGKYHYRDVTGPDEYHDHVDDNAYTNHLAQWHLTVAGEVLQWLQSHHPEHANELGAKLGLSDDRVAEWAEVAAKMYLPQPGEDGVTEQFEGFFQLEDADLALLRDPERTQPIQSILGVERTEETQTLKQPDVLMLHYLLPERFTADRLRADFDYYDPRTDHEYGSSLGPAISAVIACWAGEPEYGYQHFLRAARADLLDVRRNTDDGIHAASAGALWQTVVMGFGGLRVTPEGWSTHPMLPKHWTRLAFNFDYRGERQRVELTHP